MWSTVYETLLADRSVAPCTGFHEPGSLQSAWESCFPHQRAGVFWRSVMSPTSANSLCFLTLRSSAKAPDEEVISVTTKLPKLLLLRPENYTNTSKMSVHRAEHIFSSSTLNVLTCQRSTDVKTLVLRKNSTILQTFQVQRHVIKSKLNLRQIERSHGYSYC